MGEDCLSLNIWVPNRSGIPDGDAGVGTRTCMVAFFFIGGGSSNRVYNATPFTSKRE
jgi:carboxylesterase type B